eukprot:s627_g6.t1
MECRPGPPPAPQTTANQALQPGVYDNRLLYSPQLGAPSGAAATMARMDQEPKASGFRNVVSLLETCAMAGVAEVIFCGITPAPPMLHRLQFAFRYSILRRARTAAAQVPSSFAVSAKEAVSRLQATGVRVWALETTSQARPEAFGFVWAASVSCCAVEELPIRFAKRIRQIEEIPDWRESQDLVKLRYLYFQSFSDLRLIDLQTSEDGDMKTLTDAVTRAKQRLQGAVPLLMEAPGCLARRGSEDLEPWLDRFLLSRIGTEMLTSHYVASMEGGSIVVKNCDPAIICSRAAERARWLCSSAGSEGRDTVHIKVETLPSANTAEGRLSFTYVPKYLYYMVLELLKNSARATIETASNQAEIESRPTFVSRNIHTYSEGLGHQVPTGWTADGGPGGVFRSILRAPRTGTAWRRILIEHCGLDQKMDDRTKVRLWWFYSRKDDEKKHSFRSLENKASDEELSSHVDMVSKVIPIDSAGKVARGNEKTSGEKLAEQLFQAASDPSFKPNVDVTCAEVAAGSAGQLSQFFWDSGLLTGNKDDPTAPVVDIIVAPNVFTARRQASAQGRAVARVKQVDLVKPDGSTNVCTFPPSRKIFICSTKIPRSEMRTFLEECEEPVYTTGDQSLAEAMWTGKVPCVKPDAKVQQWQLALMAKCAGTMESVPDLGVVMRQLTKDDGAREAARAASKRRSDECEKNIIAQLGAPPSHWNPTHKVLARFTLSRASLACILDKMDEQARMIRMLRLHAIVEMEGFLRQTTTPPVPSSISGSEIVVSMGIGLAEPTGILAVGPSPLETIRNAVLLSAASSSTGSTLAPAPSQGLSRRYDYTPTSTCSDLGMYMNAMNFDRLNNDHSSRPVLSPTSTQGELPPLDAKLATLGRYGSLTLEEIPEFRTGVFWVSYTMPDLVSMEQAKSRTTTLASLPEIELEDENELELEEEDDDEPWLDNNIITRSIVIDRMRIATEPELPPFPHPSEVPEIRNFKTMTLPDLRYPDARSNLLDAPPGLTDRLTRFLPRASRVGGADTLLPGDRASASSNSFVL